MSEPTPLDTIEKTLSHLSPGEKAHLLQKVAQQLSGAVPGHELDRYLDARRRDFDMQREAARNADPMFYQKLADARKRSPLVR